jgi:hypothetical protein
MVLSMAEPHTDPDPEDEDGSASTPFDNPFFLPVLLWIFAAWFLYDGWFNASMEWIQFNRWGFAVSGILAVYYTVRGLRERREERARGSEASK